METFLLKQRSHYYQIPAQQVLVWIFVIKWHSIVFLSDKSICLYLYLLGFKCEDRNFWHAVKTFFCTFKEMCVMLCAYIPENISLKKALLWIHKDLKWHAMKKDGYKRNNNIVLVCTQP